MSHVEHHRMVEESGSNLQMECNHTLHHRDQDGRLTGTWDESIDSYGVRVSCRVCNKFYGYQRIEDNRKEKEMYEAYLEQQRRRACPGCGESPFLG